MGVARHPVGASHGPWVEPTRERRLQRRAVDVGAPRREDQRARARRRAEPSCLIYVVAVHEVGLV